MAVAPLYYRKGVLNVTVCHPDYPFPAPFARLAAGLRRRTYAAAYPYPHAHPYFHAYAHAYAYGHSRTYAHAYPNAHAYGYARSYAHAHAYPHTHDYSYAHAAGLDRRRRGIREFGGGRGQGHACRRGLRVRSVL